MSADNAFLVISPHFDDAVLSVGAWLSRHPGTVVATVCSELPGPDVAASDWDAAGGFLSGNDAVKRRRIEDENALRMLGAEQFLLGFLDGPYRSSGEADLLGSITEAVERVLVDLRPDRVLFPLGWPQPDHHVTSEASLAASVRTKVPAIAYAELPYRIVRPSFVSLRLQELHNRGLRVREYPTPTGDLALKRSAAECYVSQMTLVGTAGCFDPDSERLYRIG
jgi:LmbE family N-acetylglucosaminyl deacetylase